MHLRKAKSLYIRKNKWLSLTAIPSEPLPETTSAMPPFACRRIAFWLLAVCSLAYGCKEGNSMILKRDSYRTGRLSTRPTTPTLPKEIKKGIQPLGLDSAKDGFLYVPKSYRPDKPAALVVMLHGSGGNADQGLSLLQRYAEAHNLLLLAPASRSFSWDIMASGRFGPDVIFLDQALAQVFQTYAIQPDRVAIGGFSDGGSYALCLGLTNGDLFTHIIAFSPGFEHTMEEHGNPSVFISHGTRDSVLPIDKCGRVIQRNLTHRGTPLAYHEFNGQHEIPATIRQKAVEWFLANPTP